MKTRRQKAAYPLPADFGRLLNVAVDERETLGAYVRLMNIAFEELRNLSASPKRVLLGLPAYACVNENKIYLWPVPDKSYNVVVRYQPPEKEF